MVPVHQVWLWFPNYPGLATGILIGGFGLAALVLDPVTTAIINPNSLQPIDGKFPSEVNANFVYMMRSFIMI